MGCGLDGARAPVAGRLAASARITERGNLGRKNFHKQRQVADATRLFRRADIVRTIPVRSAGHQSPTRWLVINTKKGGVSSLILFLCGAVTP
jgi:hypothetical protein